MKYFITIILLLSFNAFGSNWNLLLEENGIKVYSKKAESSTIPFKASGIINANIELVLNALKDHESKNKWSPKLDYVKMHRSEDNDYVFSEYYKTPWPASDREFLLKGKIVRLGNNQIKLLAKSINDNTLKSHAHVQADVKYINLILTKISTTQTNIDFEFHGDMKGYMPYWLMNLIQKKWPYRFIEGLRAHIKTKNMNIASRE